MGSRFEALWADALAGRNRRAAATGAGGLRGPLTALLDGGPPHTLAPLSIGEESDDAASASCDGRPSLDAGAPNGADVHFSVGRGPHGGGGPPNGPSRRGHGLGAPSADDLLEAGFVAACLAAAASWASEDARVGAWPRATREAFVQVTRGLGHTISRVARCCTFWKKLPALPALRCCASAHLPCASSPDMLALANPPWRFASRPRWTSFCAATCLRPCPSSSPTHTARLGSKPCLRLSPTR
jgi:hypothetical protein